MKIMPCPRLEFEWIMTGKDWGKRDCVYSLVIPLTEFDIRREDENGVKVRSEWKVEIGRTNVIGGRRDHPPIWDDGTIDTPFRDGAHAKFDSEVLGGLPIVAVCGDTFHIVDHS